MKTKQQNTYVKIFLYCLLYLSFSTHLYCEESHLDAREIGLGQIQATSSGSANPASLGFLNKAKVGINVYNKFEMKELNTISIYALKPNDFLDCGIRISQFGFSDYKVWTIQPAIAKKINSKLAIGGKLNWRRESIYLEDKPRMQLSADLGITYKKTESWKLNILLKNIANKTNTYKPSIHIGTAFILIEDLEILAESTTYTKDYTAFHIGAEYGIAQSIYIRLGYRSNPNTPSMGFAYTYNSFAIDIAYLSHNILGNSSSINIAYQF